MRKCSVIKAFYKVKHKGTFKFGVEGGTKHCCKFENKVLKIEHDINYLKSSNKQNLLYSKLKKYISAVGKC